MALDDLLATLERRAADTPDTPCNPIEVSAKPAPILACTLDTLDTPQIDDARKNTGNEGATSWGWLLHFADSEPAEVFTSPESTLAEVLRDFPEAIAAEPLPVTPTRPAKPLTAEVETTIRAWLALIEETDPAIIADVLGRCRTDPEALDYFTGRAGNRES